ncbi:PIN domain-containing protein [Roseburia hominis]|uniref:PIN domain-containing protein n=1 Tax=Roseburia hominis TaxID=301301 RepID=UPI0022E664F2|nr:PIN domain-containing protein [Roseburia hominis]
MGKIYLVDSENVGDIWVPLLVSSQEDDEVLVFYTTKSPHMNYENVRMLKETEKEADFIKCFEGSNALDFQLVSELGYRLSQNADREYVIVSNDTGFDAAVRYWSTRKMPVSRLSGKECHRMLTEKKQRVAKESGAAAEPEQEQTRAAGPEVEAEQVRETGQEAEAERIRETGPEAEAERGREQSKKPRSSKKSEPSKAGGKAGESGNPEASGKVGNAEESGKAEPAENAGLAEESGKAEPAENAGLAGESGKPEVTGKAEDAEESGKPEVTGKAEDAETSGKSESAEKAGLAEESGKAEPAEKTGRAKRSRKSAKAEKSERMSEPDRSEKSQKSDKAKTQNAGNEKPDLTEEQSGQMTEMMDLKEEMSENPQSVSNATDQSEAPVKFGLDLNAERAILKTLCACISKENLVDFHNALVALLGEEEGKRLYQELKTNAEYASYWSELPAYGLKEKFDMYCKMVFDHSEYAKEPPEDFSGFLYQANGKRKNLNSLRAALQGHYGKDKGMKYYSLFKSHIKMMNRM